MQPIEIVCYEQETSASSEPLEETAHTSLHNDHEYRGASEEEPASKIYKPSRDAGGSESWGEDLPFFADIDLEICLSVILQTAAFHRKGN